ncbi:hypothetical protein EV178_000257 [Coemansia sp. RSA 1646]|nr:hypothetical protein EV178_000257 [Coemansia sp. RSA 1646]
MASNDSGYYTNGSKHAEQPFRRPTGKVVMVGGDVNGPIYEYRQQSQQPQLYYPKERSGATVQQQQQQQQYSGPAHSLQPPVHVPTNAYASNDGAHSAIPAPQGFQHQLPPHAQSSNHPGHYQNQGYPPQQISQPNGHYASIAPPNTHPSNARGSPNIQQQQQQQQQQQPREHYQEEWQEQSYYQHHTADANRTTYSNNPAFLADDFQQLSMHPGYSSGTRTPVSELPRRGTPTQHLKMSADTLRQREQKLEDDYDNDDGSASVGIDISLFPSNPAQVTNLGRSDRYAASANPNPNIIGPSSPLVPGAPPARHQNGTPVSSRGPPSGMSRNASPHSIQIPASFAAVPQGQAPGHGPYDNGFDSSSDRVYLGVRPATSQQNLRVAHGTRVGSGSYGEGGRFPAVASMYNNSSSGDALVGHEPPLQPYAGMRPWTSSSRSLPLGTGQQQQQLPPSFSERDAPSSSASSVVGVPPMASVPSAKAVPPSSPKAPPPTAASLEAYRASVKRSSDTEAQLEFAKYVLEHAKGIAEQERNPKLANKRYEVLVAEGLKWVKKLAGGGITVHRSSTAAEAQFFLGTIHSRGSYGVERDDAKAFAYYQQASKSQHAEANYRTAVCYEVGVGTRRDPTRAQQFYRKSAAQSNVPAMYKLGLILIKGLLGAAPSPREGITWLKRAAENATPECPHGLHELALCHETDDIPGIIQDLAYSRELYIKAGKLGYLPSQVRLGQAYEYGTLGCPIDARRSIGWYTRAAEKNDADAELALSGWYLTGADPFLPQNDVEAYLWARRAADRGLAKAEYAVGYYYECGIGVTRPDVKEAQKWYARAANQQNRRAMNRLKELKKMGVNGASVSKASRPRRNKGGSMF